MTDKEENLYGGKFLTLCDSAQTAAEVKLENCTRRDSAFCYLYLGNQYAYRSIWESRFRSNFSALKPGMKAKSAYQKGLEVDSTFYDLYLGLGNYHYWKSVKSGLLRSFGLFKDERERGIEEIELAADSSLFSRDAALSALIWILIDRKDYESAMIPAMELNRKYPNGNTFFWPLGEVYFKSGQYEKTAEIYDMLYQRLTNAPGNYYNIIECLDRLYHSFDKLNNSDKKRETISELRALYNNIPEEVRRKQKEKLSDLMKQKY